MDDKRGHVLVADDDKVVRKICQTALEGAGFEVSFAENGQQAFDMVVEKDYDLLLTDMEMPVMDGMTLLERLQEIPVAPPVIMITAHGYVPQAVRALTHGAYDFVTKPFVADALVASVNRCLEAHRLKKEVRTLRVLQSILPVLQELINVRDSRRLTQLIPERTCELFAAEGASLLLYEESTRSLVVKAVRGPYPKNVLGSKMRAGERVAGQALELGRVIRLQGPLKKDPRFSALPSHQEVASSLTGPLLVEKEAVGVLCVKRLTAGRPFSEEDEQVFSLICHFMALALSNAVAHESLRQTKDVLEQQLEQRSLAFEKTLTELQELKSRQSRA